MTAYLLDTSSLIQATKLGGSIRDRLEALVAASQEVAICAVTLSEYYSGVERGAAPRWDRFIDLLEYWDIPRDVAEHAGSYRRRFARLGTPLSVPDTLLAALARERGAVLVTENLKDFPMDDIRVVTLA